jgi:FKBP-type peptidyl-prolyl cis-trans isomerase FklB
MKQLFTSVFILFSIGLMAQKPAPKKPATPPPPPAAVLKNNIDSVSYAAGISVANFYKEQGLANINTAQVTKAINDVLKTNKPLFDNNTANNILQQFMTKMQGQKAKTTIETCQKYLDENKKKNGVITTGSGLQYEILVPGKGVKPTAEDTVVCHYKGTFIDGKPFDNSYDRGQPATFPLNGVIRGWTEGLQYMQVGGKYKFYIPYNLAYGEYDNMSIPGGSTLVFEVELLDVKKKSN